MPNLIRIYTILGIALPIGLAGIILSVQAWRVERKHRAARSWPQTGGVIIACDLLQTHRRYTPHIVYEYEVSGVRYESQRLSTGENGRATDKDRAWQTAARFPVGRRVPVYYDPGNPTQAVLEREVSLTAWILWLASVLVLALAGVLAGFVLSLAE